MRRQHGGDPTPDPRCTMQMPVQVAFKGLEPSESIETACRNEAGILEHFYDRITRCRVLVEAPNHRRQTGHLYRVRIELTVPGARLVASRSQGDRPQDADVYVAVRHAFDQARRQLEDHVHKLRGRVKSPEPSR